MGLGRNIHIGNREHSEVVTVTSILVTLVYSLIHPYYGRRKKRGERRCQG